MRLGGLALALALAFVGAAACGTRVRLGALDDDDAGIEPRSPENASPAREACTLATPKDSGSFVVADDARLEDGISYGSLASPTRRGA